MKKLLRYNQSQIRDLQRFQHEISRRRKTCGVLKNKFEVVARLAANQQRQRAGTSASELEVLR